MARPKTKKDKFQFAISEKVEYIGKLFEMYSHTECEVLGRSTSRSKIYYKVKFEDGKILQFVENLLRKVGDESDKI